MRAMTTQFVNVSPTGATATVTGNRVSSICVISENIAVPIYWRVDGLTATVRGSGCYVTVGVGGMTMVDIDHATSVTVSLISTGTGSVQIMGMDAI